MPQLKAGPDYRRKEDILFRRDAGAVALLLPAEEVDRAKLI